MRYATVVLAVGSLAGLLSCRSAVVLRYTGKDVSDPEGYLIIRGDRERSRVVITSPKYGCTLTLPYLEDWEVGSDASYAVRARSRTSGFAATVEIFSGKRPSSAEEFLRKEILEKEQAGQTEQGILVRNPSIENVGPHPVLEYLEERYATKGVFVRESVRTMAILLVFSVRQRENGDLYLVELLSPIMEEPDRSTIRAQMRDIAGEQFSVLP